MQIYSPNMLKTFSECEKKYELKYIKKINLPQNAKLFEKGKKIHALAHYYLKGNDITKFLQTLTEEEYSLWQKLLNNEYFQKKYVNSEYNLSARIGDFWFGGRIDALVETDKTYYILDYKTGSTPENPKTDFQTMIYLICTDKILEKLWGNNFNLNFVYIDLKNAHNYLVEFTPQSKITYEETLINTIKKITTTNNFSKNPSRCKFCEYNKICNKI